MPYVDACGGFNEVLKAIGTTVKTYKYVGVIIDSNGDADARRKQVLDAFQRAGITFPQATGYGTPAAVFSVGDRRYGIWLMPGDGECGQLEDFLASIVPGANALKALADRFVSESRQSGATWKDVDKSRAEICAWLSVQEEPGARFGDAISKGYFDVNHPRFQALCAWVKALFID